ncbi:MAG: DNA polymerase I [Acidobacteria bacterium]|nr:DNA polymerase I [Acidobacteriota bacterium]
MPNKKRLFLIDGMSNIFRSYYAIRGLSNSKGLATNAVYGFTMTLRKMIAEHKPDYLGVVLDSKEKTFRQEKFEAYKSNRPEMPEDLAQQLPYIDRVCAALRVPVVKMPKYEADDILGTLARQATAEGLQTVIVTNDKDLAQLVQDPDVVMLRVEKNMGETFLDEAGVKAKFGVRADQIVDWLGLMGDPVDCIPGAPGIGEKGAVGLLEQFDNIENALARWEEVKRKTYRESLRDNAEQIRLSRELATVDCNVPVKLDLKGLIYEAPDYQAAHELFSELEFATLTREFAKGAAESEQVETKTAETTDSTYERISTVKELGKLVKSLADAGRFAFALSEAADGSLTGVAFSSEANSATHFDLAECNDRDGAIKLLKEVFGNRLIEKATFDLKRAIHALDPLGVSIETATDDTLLQGYLLDSERSKYEVTQLANEHLGGYGLAKEQDLTAQAAELNGRLADAMNSKIADDKLQFDFQEQTLDYVYQQIEMPLVPLLCEMENAGFRVDTDVLAKLSVEMAQEIERLSQEIYVQAGREFNIGSPQQLGEVFEELNFEVSKRTATGQISTSRDVLDELAVKYELPRLVIDHRELAKLKSTYVDAFPSLINPVDGRIHTTLNQTIAATGRISSTDPNLQNIPIRTEMGRRIRRAFIPADGCVLLSADYSQIELRLLAHITKDPVMLDAFTKGEDIHERTAREVFGAKTAAELKEKRRVAKIVNFGIAYVIGPFGLAQRVGINRSEARKVIDDWYRTYANVKKYMDELPEQARSAGNVARSIYGRLRRMPDLASKGAARARAEREAVNMPMQGSASDIVKLAMLHVWEALKKEKLHAKMILQVHDELVFEVPKKELKKTSEIVKTAMEHAVKLAVPLPVELGSGENWMDAKP